MQGSTFVSGVQPMGKSRGQVVSPSGRETSLGACAGDEVGPIEAPSLIITKLKLVRAPAELSILVDVHSAIGVSTRTRLPGRALLL